MDDGYSPVSILVLIGFILLEAVFYGFGSAIQNVNEGKLEEEARQGNRKMCIRDRSKGGNRALFSTRLYVKESIRRYPL